MQSRSLPKPSLRADATQPSPARHRTAHHSTPQHTPTSGLDEVKPYVWPRGVTGHLRTSSLQRSSGPLGEQRPDQIRCLPFARDPFVLWLFVESSHRRAANAGTAMHLADGPLVSQCCSLLLSDQLFSGKSHPAFGKRGRSFGPPRKTLAGPTPAILIDDRQYHPDDGIVIAAECGGGQDGDGARQGQVQVQVQGKAVSDDLDR